MTMPAARPFPPRRVAGAALVALGVGLAACRDTAVDGPGLTGAPVPASISLGAPSLTLTSVGGATTLAAVVRDANGAPLAAPTLTWSSDAPEVATVNGDGPTATVAAHRRGAALITVRAGHLSTGVTVFVRTAHSIGVTPSAVTLRAGQATALVAFVNADEGASRAVRWSSSNPAIATVSPEGAVTAVSMGTATITARAESDTSVRADAAITVTPALGVRLAPASLTLGRDESRTLQAEIVLAAGQVRTVHWRSSHPHLVSVSQQGVVTGIGDGEATITATSHADPTLRGTALVRVGPVLRQLAVAPATATLNIGQTRSFTASATADAGADAALSWRVDNPAVASISAQGVATAVGTGTTTIRVRSAADTTREATATLVVAPRPVTITLGTRTLSLLTGGEATLNAVVSADPDVSTAVRWTSRHAGVASVDAAGRVTAVQAGTTHIIAEAEADASRRDSVAVTVTPRLATSWTPDRLGGPLIEDIVSLWAPAPTLAYAVNSLGDLYRWDGTSWARTLTGSQFGTRFTAVHGAADDAVTAVGSSGVIVRWDGAAWTAMPSGTQATLTDVWMHSRDTAWAVGTEGTTLRRTGGAWVRTTSNTSATLRAVSGSGREAFAVGDAGVVRRFQNGAWLTVTVPSAETLRDVWAAAGLAGEVVIVGDFGTLLRWQGSAFVADAAAGGVNLFAVDMVPDGSRTLVAGDGLVLSRATGAWQQLTVPYRTRFTAVAAPAGGLWVGGQRGLVMRSNWNASAWSTLSLTPDLLDVWSTGASHTLAVGELGFIFRHDGATWTRQLAPTLERLNTVWAASPSAAFAGGDNGTLLRWQGAAWVTQPSPTTEHIYAMWGASAQAVWAVTQGGEVLFWNGSTWAVVHTQARPLYGVSGTGPSDVHAVGLDGVALHFDGTDWQTRTTGTNHVLVGLWAGPGGRAVTVGARDFTSGVALRFDGSGWQELAAGTSQILSAVSGATDADLYAVGDAGTVLRYNGTGWAPMPSNTQEFLWAVTGAPDANGGGFAVGLNGTVLQAQQGAAVAAARRGGRAAPRMPSLEPAPGARTARPSVLRSGELRRGAVRRPAARR
jgi:uncharacterized protein YjdB